MAQPSKTTKLTKDEVDRLIRDFQTHDNKEAQETLVEVYTNLVEMLAKKYSKGKSFHEDLRQVGMIGLLGAIKRYDPEVGKSFEAFAIPTIIGEIKRFLRDKTWSVHVPRRIKELGPRIKMAVDQLTTETQRSPKVEEIAAFLDVSEEEVLETMEMGKSYQALSVDHSIEADADGSTVTILDIVGSHEEGYERVNQQMMLKSVLHVLSDREKQIIDLTFVQNKSQKETGDILGISQMHVSRLQRKAVKKLREALIGDPSMELM
ncbi:RNA polymerase sigma factor SigB [Bacillus amyloliquefaciens]|uniref:RNA polymerase sigma factor SigB n=1 Tax=Bacillus amyloliquefaciens TaxID=1390 RepID=UPI0015800A06|nr:RNA polymerase sigma factor SigB [Bacillus amyloliquefaciens]NUI23880.1 RNA polymerase sigma factor SigB [Bacillus amyloliquefaciens]NUI32867.1 RNA polymerase sigma factor SigB [Bacillus amyloliquefaciens]NUI36573.1 RNA polymerase sigma factor SigB [Bacillus amyloliquefaciens]NUI70231.1 RNA polymerase sigma factor SigB [Bacillus amyloliquefaciens]NUI73838.1 RNA polymerase sigma factor SigB [Bacillus amyloliquefaciens]